jgi:hypothetical protein
MALLSEPGLAARYVVAFEAPTPPLTSPLHLVSVNVINHRGDITVSPSRISSNDFRRWSLELSWLRNPDTPAFRARIYLVFMLSRRENDDLESAIRLSDFAHQVLGIWTKLFGAQHPDTVLSADCSLRSQSSFRVENRRIGRKHDLGRV